MLAELVQKLVDLGRSAVSAKDKVHFQVVDGFPNVVWRQNGDGTGGWVDRPVGPPSFIGVTVPDLIKYALGRVDVSVGTIDPAFFVSEVRVEFSANTRSDSESQDARERACSPLAMSPQFYFLKDLWNAGESDEYRAKDLIRLLRTKFDECSTVSSNKFLNQIRFMEKTAGSSEKRIAQQGKESIAGGSDAAWKFGKDGEDLVDDFVLSVPVYTDPICGYEVDIKVVVEIDPSTGKFQLFVPGDMAQVQKAALAEICNAITLAVPKEISVTAGHFARQS